MNEADRGGIGRIVATDRATLGRSKLFWASAVVGWTIIVAAIIGAVGNARHTKPLEWGAWIIGGAVLHDAVMAPIVFVFGGILRRGAPRRLRATITAGLTVTALVALATFPIFSGLGVRSDNPSHLPRDYWTGLGIVIGILWVGVGAVLVRTWRRRSDVPAEYSPPRT
jgi:hypothetical protein